MLPEVYGSMSERQRQQVAQWEKEQIAHNHFNCTQRPSAASGRSKSPSPGGHTRFDLQLSLTFGPSQGERERNHLFLPSLQYWKRLESGCSSYSRPGGGDGMQQRDSAAELLLPEQIQPSQMGFLTDADVAVVSAVMR